MSAKCQFWVLAPLGAYFTKGTSLDFKMEHLVNFTDVRPKGTGLREMDSHIALLRVLRARLQRTEIVIQQGARAYAEARALLDRTDRIGLSGTGDAAATGSASASAEPPSAPPGLAPRPSKRDP